MYCVILAAGLGTRMGILTENCPKPMLLIHEKPKLAYSIEILPDVVTDVVLVVGYLKEQIMEYFGERYEGRRIHYVMQNNYDGTAGAVRLCNDVIDEERFLVIMGDDLYMRDDLQKLFEHDQSVLAYNTMQAENFGLVDIDTEFYLTGVIERPHNKKEGLINTGAYFLNRKYFDAQTVKISDKEYGLPQTLVSMYPACKTKVVEANDWLAIGTPQDLQRAQKEIFTFIS